MVVIRAGQSMISFPTSVPGSVVLSEQKTGLCLVLWGLFKLYFSLHGFFFSKVKGTLLRLSSIRACKNQNK